MNVWSEIFDLNLILKFFSRFSENQKRLFKKSNDVPILREVH